MIGIILRIIWGIIFVGTLLGGDIIMKSGSIPPGVNTLSFRYKYFGAAQCFAPLVPALLLALPPALVTTLTRCPPAFPPACQLSGNDAVLYCLLAPLRLLLLTPFPGPTRLDKLTCAAAFSGKSVFV